MHEKLLFLSHHQTYLDVMTADFFNIDFLPSPLP
jgi:hypothetical protein